MPIKRESIVAALAARLAGITVANGYNTNAGANVTIWRVTSFDVNELPAINIADIRDEVIGEQIPLVQDWRLSVRIHAIADPAQLADGTLRMIVADVYKAIGVDHTFSGSAIKTDLETDEMELDQKESRLGIATINIGIHYRTNKFQEE